MDCSGVYKCPCGKSHEARAMNIVRAMNLEATERWPTMNEPNVPRSWLGMAEASITIRCIECEHGTTINGLDPVGLGYRGKFLDLGWRKLAGKWVCPGCAEDRKGHGR
jgi:hypothetical protein